MRRQVPIYTFLLVIFVYVVYSYALLDPNLVLNSHPLYWKFQQMMWNLGYHQRQLSGLFFAIIITLLVVSWKYVSYAVLSVRKSILMTIVLVLLLAQPALSHDVYNYMFNAKMLIKYQLDPHVHVALEISSDPWLRFMHNVHTPAPYGHGWTYISVIPYVLGFEKFLLTLFNFKLFMFMGWVIWLLMLRKIYFTLQYTSLEPAKDFFSRWWILAFCPLILLEHLGTMHNDLWMMIPLLCSYLCLFQARRDLSRKLLFFLGSLVFFLLSIWMKIVPIVTLPILGMLWLSNVFTDSFGKITFIFQKYWADFSAIVLLAPLLTLRSQQFHPWYLVWSLSFYPFVRLRWLRLLLISLSISSLYRYIPFLLAGEYSDTLLFQQRVITWGGAIVMILLGQLISLIFYHHARMKK